MTVAIKVEALFECCKCPAKVTHKTGLEIYNDPDQEKPVIIPSTLPDGWDTVYKFWGSDYVCPGCR